jgi:signal transduction histidine kinase/CheY-like chemotaxis protein
LNHDQPYDTEFRVVWPDASIHHIKSNAVVLRGEDNQPEKMVGADQDITIHKQAEEALRLANAEMERALRMKDEFLANMSHELRTPLNAILGISESLEEQFSGSLNEKQLKYVRIINESGRHLLDLINDILDLSKIEAGKLEINIQTIPVERFCTSCLRMVKELAHKKSLEIVFKADEKVQAIKGDERRLKQTLVNLLGNAVKFTPENRKIGLEVSGNPEKNEVTFTVWDEGIGIDPKNIPLLFKPFVQLDTGLTREYAGTGLGLALVAQMVRLHGGRVNLTSKLHEGSRFMVTLPWMPIEQKNQLPHTAPLQFRSSKPNIKHTGRILVVDDTELVSQLVCDYLENMGYETLVAEDGKEAVSIAKQEHPNLILMDVMMPVMSGLDATKQIRTDPTLKDVPIIGLTAMAMPEDRQRCLDAGMNDHLGKPIQMQELAQVIERYINTHKDLSKEESQ